MNEYVASDLFRLTGKTNYMEFLITYIRNRTFRFQVALRLRQSTKRIEKYTGCLLWLLNRTKHVIDIHPQTRIGYGLYLGHAGGGIVVHPSAVIGNNCNLSQFTTIGTNCGKAAIIGDNVYIGPNVAVVDDVIIGSNVSIGAGSIVTKDIPDNATAVGNYAKVISYDNPGRFIRNPYICKENKEYE